MSNTYRGSGTPRTGSVITIGADEIANAPYGDIIAEDMQSAINELDDEKVALAGDTMTGDLTVPNLVTAGNVDGRDVSVDGTALDTAVSKLAGIEAGATADQTAAEVVNTPAGTIVATDVQAAINELDSDVTGLSTSKVDQTSSTGSGVLPSGTEAQRDGTPAGGYLRFNSDVSKAEIYDGTAWSSVGGGATGAGGDDIFYENGQTVTTDYTITTNKNAMTAGVVTIDTGVTVTVPTGSTWSIV